MGRRENVVKQAESWLGLKESNGSFRVIVDVYNTFVPHPRGFKMNYTTAWCATFVSAVAIKCGCTDIIPVECSCEEQVKLFKKLGSWVEDDAYEANAGDIIYYDWQDNGVGDDKGWSDHVGIVQKRVGDTLYVIEGNNNDSVMTRKVKVNAKYIRGFGVPKYNDNTNFNEKAVSEFVERLYTVVLGRQSDSDGKKYWVDKLRNGVTGKEVAYGFFNSVEFVNKSLTDEQYVEVLYNAFLGRGSDPIGKADWVNRIAQGTPRAKIMDGFVNSVEFANICKYYGINSGSTTQPTI